MKIFEASITLKLESMNGRKDYPALLSFYGKKCCTVYANRHNSHIALNLLPTLCVTAQLLNYSQPLPPFKSFAISKIFFLL